MGSATRAALASGREVLAGQGSAVSVRTGEDLFAAGQGIGTSRQLLAALTDPSAATSAKTTLVRAVFGKLDKSAVAVLETLATSPWSQHDDLLSAVEELGIRAIASSAADSATVQDELFSVERTVDGNAELELALGSKLGGPVAKAELVDALLAGKASGETVAIVRHVLAQPRGRSVGEALRTAAAIVADQAEERIATVTTANELDSAQLDRLRDALSARYERRLRINQVVDPSILGGVRVQIGDDVIDGSIATRLATLRLQLAG